MKGILKAIGIICIIILFIALFQRDKIRRLIVVNSLFDEENIVDNFQDMETLFPSYHIPRSSKPLTLERNIGYSFPDTFIHEGGEYATKQFLDETMTEGLLIIHKDTIIYEDYRLGLEPDEKHISWSMSKSFIGTLIGIAVEKGQLTITDQVTDHLPEFQGTGYDGVTVEDLLQMRSGVKFNEDYGDFNSDINRFGRAFALGTSYKEFAKSLKNEVTPGSRCKYVSVDTQMLGFILSKATGQSLSELLHTDLWEPMGMEDDAEWIKDNTGFEMALGGMVASLRDYAKLGLLYLHKGHLNGQQILSSEWIDKATSIYEDGGLTDQSKNSNYGYGYQWWIPPYSTGGFFAVGIYDQFIYVYPEKDLVITKLSADHNFKTNGAAIKARHISMFQEMARHF
jgi:CubicO group peptidase (beta-lactamase class C family)